MKKKNLIKALLDGLVQSVSLICLLDLFLSVYTSNFSLIQYTLYTIISAIICSIVYFILVLKEVNNKIIIGISLGSVLSFVVLSGIFLVSRLAFTASLFPLREINNADGILVLLTSVCFLIYVAVLKLSIFIFFLVKNNNKTRNDSLS